MSKFEIKNNVITKCLKYDKKLVIPEGIVKIGDEVCIEMENIKEIVFPKTLKEIGEHLFATCYQEKAVYASNKLFLFGGYVFSNVSINLPTNIKTIHGNSFAGGNEIVININHVPNIVNNNKPEFPLPLSLTKYRFVDDSNKTVAVITYFTNSKYFDKTIYKKIINCLVSKNGQFNFAQFDKLFDILDKTGKCSIAAVRTLYPYQLSKTNEKKYSSFIRKNNETVCKELLLSGDPFYVEVVRELVEKKVFSIDMVARTIEYVKKVVAINDKGEFGGYICPIFDTKFLKSLENYINENVDDVQNIKKSNSVKREEYISKIINEARKKHTLSKDSDFVVKNGQVLKYSGTAETVVVPKGVKSLDFSIFNFENKIKNLIVQEGVETLQLNKDIDVDVLAIPDSVKKVNKYAKLKAKILILPEIFYEKNHLDRHWFREGILVIPNLPFEDIEDIEFAIDEELTPEEICPGGEMPTRSSIVKPALALGFLMFSDDYKNNLDYKGYKKYVLNKKKTLLKDIYKYDVVEALEFYDSIKSITLKNIEDCYEVLYRLKTRTQKSDYHDGKIGFKCNRYLDDWMDKNGLISADEYKKTLKKEDKELVDLIKCKDIRDIDRYIKSAYSLKLEDLPKVMHKGKKESSSYYLACLLYLFAKEAEKEDKDIFKSDSDFIRYSKSLLDNADINSFQDALITYMNSMLKYNGYTVKMNALKPFAYFADENTMDFYLKEGVNLCYKNGFRGNKHGLNFDVMLQFWAVHLSKNVVMYLCEHEKLQHQSKIYGLSEVELIEKYLYEPQFDNNGRTAINLSNEKLIAYINNDFKFIIEDNNGKHLKSLPNSKTKDKSYKKVLEDYTKSKEIATALLKAIKDSYLYDYFHGKTKSVKEWEKEYSKNAVRKLVMNSLIWNQGKNTFKTTDKGFILSNGKPYKLNSKLDIGVAHVLNMTSKDIELWRDYFIKNNITQIFEQIWEIPTNFNAIKKNRYEHSPISPRVIKDHSQDGIIYHESYYIDEYCEYKEEGYFEIEDDVIDMESYETENEEDDENDEVSVVISNIKINEKNVLSSHILYLIDKWVINDMIKKDDVSLIDSMNKYNLYQIEEFIKLANKCKANNVKKALIEYKNKKYTNI